MYSEKSNASIVKDFAEFNTRNGNGSTRFSRRKYFDEILSQHDRSDFTFSHNYSPDDKLVALAISHYANSIRKASYVDPLTIAKALGVKHATVVAAINILKSNNHLSAHKRRDGLVDLVPRSADTEFGSPKSAKCDSGFFKQRAALIERIIFDHKLTPGQRIVALGIVAMTDPDSGQCDAGQSYLAKSLHVNRRTVIKAIPKLVELGYVLRTASESGAVKSCQWWTCVLTCVLTCVPTPRVSSIPRPHFC